MNVKYTRGDAAAYEAWLQRQEPRIAEVAARFRPWEIYKLEGCDLLVKVVGHDADEHVALLQVQYLSNPHSDGVITVTDSQLELWGVAELDTDAIIPQS